MTMILLDLVLQNLASHWNSREIVKTDWKISHSTQETSLCIEHVGMYET
jgi:hypothetical protein